MPLVPGDRLGPYTILAHIGAGGMGDVYQARDTRLDRAVALKVSKEEFSERFMREAKAVAALNHPHICQLYDVGPNFLVMEFVEGSPPRGPLAFDKAVEYGLQILDALDHAHRKGIAHRDLKPGNLMVGKAGVKLLDFGLAKFAASPLSKDMRTTADPLTAQGAILGTLQYMSPEQLQAKEADARSDLFSFGCVLYEMLTGKRAFEGDNAASIIAAVLEREPAPIDAAPPLDRVIRRALAKDPDHRFQTARDLRAALEWAAAPQVAVTTAPHAESPAPHSLRWIAALAAGLLLGGAAAIAWMPKDDIPENLRFTPIATDAGREWRAKFSPDGKSVAYSKLVDGTDQIFVRSMETGAATQLTRLAFDSTVQSWSPDGARLYFVSGNDLFMVAATGGPPEKVLPDVASAALSPDGQTLVFRTARQDSWWLSSPPGAQPRKFLDVQSGGIPQFSPDGTKIWTSGAGAIIDFPSGRTINTTIPRLSFAEWMPDSRHLVGVADEQDRPLKIVNVQTGAAHSLLSASNALQSPTVSSDGTRIVYNIGDPDYDIEEFSIDGKHLRTLIRSSQMDQSAQYSPDGSKFWYTEGSTRRSELMLADADSLVSTRVRESQALYVTLSPDGKRLASIVRGDIEVMVADGGEPVRIRSTESDADNSRGTAPGEVCWTSDGTSITFPFEGANWIVSAAGGVAPRKVGGTRVRGPIANPCGWSPNGEWLAYAAIDGIRIVRADGADERLIVEGRQYNMGLFNRRGELMVTLRDGEPAQSKIVTFEIPSGRKLSAVTLDLAPNFTVTHFALHPDGQRMAITVRDFKYDIWMVEGFARPVTGWRRFFRHWE